MPVSRLERSRHRDTTFSGILASLHQASKDLNYILYQAPVSGRAEDIWDRKRTMPNRVPEYLEKCGVDLKTAASGLESLYHYFDSKKGGLVTRRYLPPSVASGCLKHIKELEEYVMKLTDRARELSEQYGGLPPEEEQHRVKGVVYGIGRLYNQISEINQELQIARLKRRPKYRKELAAASIITLILFTISIFGNTTGYFSFSSQLNIYLIFAMAAIAIVILFLFFKHKSS